MNINPVRHTALLPGTLKNLFFPPERNEYVYFARAAECGFAAGTDLVKAAWSADASMLAYARYGPARMSDHDLDTNFGAGGLRYLKIPGGTADWNAAGTQALFAFRDEFAILAFRGTELTDLLDSMDDADVLLRLEGPLPCLVHKGFQDALNQVWGEVQRIVADYRSSQPGAEIRITGHSLGGALAVLAYSRFSDPHMSLCTFGCPRVGNGPFGDRLMAHPGLGLFRFVNFNDAVAHVPTSSLVYRQVPSGALRFDQDGILAPAGSDLLGDLLALLPAARGVLAVGDPSLPAPPSVVDHSAARYCFRLWDCIS